MDDTNIRRLFYCDNPAIFKSQIRNGLNLISPVTVKAMALTSESIHQILQ